MHQLLPMNKRMKMRIISSNENKSSAIVLTFIGNILCTVHGFCLTFLYTSYYIPLRYFNNIHDSVLVFFINIITH